MARVLVVEGDTVARTLLTSQLRTGGHIVLASESSESASALIGKLGCPDVMIVDVDLPGTDGISALQHVRHDLCPFPVGGVVISAADCPTATPPQVGPDRDVHLQKPVTASDLLRAVDDVTPGRGHTGVPPAPALITQDH
jgi:CheY-like chemotaxis protein